MKGERFSPKGFPRIARLAGLAASLMLWGCGGSAPAPPEAAVTGEESPVVVQAGTPAEAPFVPADAPQGLYLHHVRKTGDLSDMIARGYIRALVVYSKTLFFYDLGHPRGISYEALREFERFLNRKLTKGSPKTHVIFVPVTRGELLPDLVAGLGDIAAANLTITPERSRVVDFSAPVADHVAEVVVTGPSAPALAAIEDLAGKQVHVRASSSYYEHLRELSRKFRAAGRPPIQIVAGDERFEDEDILEMVNAGLLPMTVIDSHKAGLWEKVFPNIRVRRDLPVNEGGEIAWAFRKESPELAGAVNEFLKGHRQGTSFGNTVLRRYYRNTKWVTNATSRKEMEKFQATIELFQRYAGQYGFDWLMIAAQAYQESGLDNSARNRSGAVGIMQVLPSTAGAPPISIRNVERLENNIHAGVKILRHYREQYFSDPGMDQENQTLMAFAGYNAGPNRINRLRKKAAGEGLDPNRWFRNVERMVARYVGREPVQYVSNVYKYYVTYKMIEGRADAAARSSR